MMSPGPLMIDLVGQHPDEPERERLRHPSTGGLIIFTRNYHSLEQVSELVREVRSLRDDLLIAVDYEGGRVQRFGPPFFKLPPMRSLGRMYDEHPAHALQLATLHGWMIGSELRAVDIDLAFAPVLDLDWAACKVIGDRALHGEHSIVTELATAHMRGLHAAGMAATGKHYPGHGHVQEDSHHELPVDRRDIDELLTHDERPFAELIEAGLESIMMAHIVYPAVDTQPASLSERWIRDELRRRLGFTGAVFCDDLSMGGAAALGDYAERARLAMTAGCDMLPVCNNRDEAERLAETIRDQRDALAAGRLHHLRGRSRSEWKVLHDSNAWHEAAQKLQTLSGTA